MEYYLNAIYGIFFNPRVVSSWLGLYRPTYSNEDGKFLTKKLEYNYSFSLPILEWPWDPRPVTDFLYEHFIWSIFISTIYVCTVYVLSIYMRDKEPMKLSKPLFYWNSIHACINTIGAVRIAQEALGVLDMYGLYHAVCFSAEPWQPGGAWTRNFWLMKIIELGDTLFLVFRKKPLTVLHVFHHFSVLIYTWHACAEHTASGRWFMMFNCAVHSVMYAYYAYSAKFGIRPSKWIAMAVTTVQICQMLAALFVTSLVFYAKIIMEGICQQSISNLYLAIGMYLIYLFLFIRYFCTNYVVPVFLAKKAHGKVE